ncbi:hypothetical protein OSTOST_16034 [Ostertagia ostertagi]
MDRLTEARKRRQSYPTREQRRASKRGRYEEDEDWTETDKAVLSYPYISQEEEQQILLASNDSASAYAQNLAKVLFADTLDLYFKDQDPAKRLWIHEAVDYRFPSGDRNAHHLKWKNCSTAINKNMRIPNGDPRTSRSRKKSNVRICHVNTRRNVTDAKKKDWLRECIDRRFYIADKFKRDQRWKVCAAACNRNRTKIIGKDGQVDEFPYFPKELEEAAFRDSNGLPYVYAEAMAKLLFPDTPHLFFKESLWYTSQSTQVHDYLEERRSKVSVIDQGSWQSVWTARGVDRRIRFVDSAPCTTGCQTRPGIKPLAVTSSAKSSSEKKDSKKDKENKKKDEETPVNNSHKEKDKDSQKEEPAETERRRAVESVLEPKAIEWVHGRVIGSKERLISVEADEEKKMRHWQVSERAEPFDSYPFMTEDEEIECYEAAKRKDVEQYARAMGRILFKDNIKALYKDQEKDRCDWFESILHFRFPTWGVFETKSKVRAAIRAINKNATMTR